MANFVDLMQVKVYAAGDTMCAEGDPGNSGHLPSMDAIMHHSRSSVGVCYTVLECSKPRLLPGLRRSAVLPNLLGSHTPVTWKDVRWSAGEAPPSLDCCLPICYWEAPGRKRRTRARASKVSRTGRCLEELVGDAGGIGKGRGRVNRVRVPRNLRAFCRLASGVTVCALPRLKVIRSLRFNLSTEVGATCVEQTLRSASSNSVFKIIQAHSIKIFKFVVVV